MPPLPKAPGERLDARPGRDAPTTFLPAGGFDGPVPDPPMTLPEDLHGEYLDLWASPMAAAWAFEEARTVAQYVAIRALVDETLGRGEFPPGTALSRMTSIEDRLLLSPKARAAAHVRFVEAPDVDAPDDDAAFWAERFGVRDSDT
jgi:hypothetical protein